ncbi:Detected protein of confused Function [Hibiscus syriacus]|uniref:Detected protein of confused Function n=1 Tax=Hibiscus syriacus TaxID=106335 RepID=A0A6A2Y5C7_HIBSY|nr:Detected protein of confused Function [Hibiscus syriacus]
MEDFVSSRRILLNGVTRTSQHDIIFPPTNPTPTIVTVPAKNPANMPAPILVPSTDPNNPITVPVTNPITTSAPITVPGAGSWCVAMTGASQTLLQSALDYACGIGGVDCSQIQQGANCYNPNTLQNHASYAFNTYYQKNPAPTSCDFGGTATIVNTNPSTGSCIFPSSGSQPTLTAIPATSTSIGAGVPGSVTPPSVLNSSTPGTGSAATSDFGSNLPPTFNTSTSTSVGFNSAIKLFKWAALQKGFNHYADTYHHIILKLGLAGHVKEMDHFCLNLARDGHVGSGEALASLVHIFVRHSRLNEAVLVLGNMTSCGFNPSVDVFNDLLGALVGKTDFERVMFVYKGMVKGGIVPNVDALNHLLEVLFETNMIELGLNQFRRMGKKGCSPNVRTFEIVLKGLVLNGRVDDAVLILYKMLELGYWPDLSFYTCTIPLFCGENRLEEGMMLLRQMGAADLVLNSVICSKMVRCLCMNLRLDEATNVLEEMMEIGEIPPVDSFVDVVNGFCEAERYDEAFRFLENNCDDLISPHKALLEGCCKAAYELLGRMIIRSVVPDCGTYAALVVGNCNLKKLRMLWNNFIIFGANSRCPLEFTTFNMLIKAVCDVGNVDEAVKLRSLAYYSGISCYTSAYASIMCALYKSERAKDVLVMFSQIVIGNCEVDAEAYCILIRNSTTHALIIGSNVNRVTSRGVPTYKQSIDEDNVSNILAEALGKW